MGLLEHQDVGKRKVKIVDADTGETLATGILGSLNYQTGADRMTNESEARIALDIPEDSDA